MKRIAAIVMISILLLAGLTSLSAVAKTRDELKASEFITCFKFGTKVTMADGSHKNVEDITKGDMLLSYNVKKGEISKVRVFSASHPIRPVVNINNGFLYVTEDHPLRIQKSDGTIGWGQIDIMPHYTKLRGQKILQIEVNDYLFTQDGKWLKITSIDRTDKTNVSVVDIFTVSGKGTFFVNGVLAYEENLYPIYWLKYYCYMFCEKHPVLYRFKDLFLF